MARTENIAVGILETGVSPDDFAARHGRFSSWTKNILAQTSVAFRYKSYRCYQGEFPPSTDACDAYVVTGSPSSTLDDDPWIAKLVQFVVAASTQNPVIGICFGHQLCHHAFGGKIETSPKGWGIGVHHYNTHINTDWMIPKLDIVRLRVSHSEQVIVPAEGATVLAGSDFCPNAITLIGENILTIQGHPDYTRENAEDLYNSRRNRIGVDHVERALRSLAQSADNIIVGNWMAQFIMTRVKSAD